MEAGVRGRVCQPAPGHTQPAARSHLQARLGAGGPQAPPLDLRRPRRDGDHQARRRRQGKLPADPAREGQGPASQGAAGTQHQLQPTGR